MLNAHIDRQNFTYLDNIYQEVDLLLLLHTCNGNNHVIGSFKPKVKILPGSISETINHINSKFEEQAETNSCTLWVSCRNLQLVIV